MSSDQDNLAGWTEQQIIQAKQAIQAWKRAGVVMEQLRRDALRTMDDRAVELLCGPADYHTPPRQARPSSGLIEQQRWFMKARCHE